MNFYTFLEVNGLKQKDLAQYLGVSEPSVSAYVSGKTTPSPDKLKKIFENPAWDTSALSEDYPPKSVQAEMQRMQELINELRTQIGRLDAQCHEYWELIKKLSDK